MIVVNALEKTYHGRAIETLVLKNVTLSIKKGELVAICGQSGCGKTTLLNILGCLDYADRGTYIYEGIDIISLGSKERNRLRNDQMGFVFQTFKLINSEKVIENVSMPLGYRGYAKKERVKKGYEILDLLGIQELGKKYPFELSGGQQQRVAIARCLITNPKVIYADEPTGNLDSQSGTIILDLFKTLASAGVTVIVVTHDGMIAQRCDRVITIANGVVEL